MEITTGMVEPISRPEIGEGAQRRLLLFGLVSSDVLTLVAAFGLAYLVRFYSGLPVFVEMEPAISFHGIPALVLLPLLLALFFAFGLYDEHNLLGGTREYSLVFQACTVGAMMAITASFLVSSVVISRGWLILAWLFGFLLVGAGRFALRRVVYGLRRRGYFLSPAIVVGTGEEGLALAAQLMDWKTSGLRLVGFVDGEGMVGSPVCCGLPLLGSIADVPALVAQHRVTEVVVATSEVSQETLMELARDYALSDQLSIRLSSGLFEILTTGVHVKEVGQVPLICLDKVRLDGVEIALKTMLDYAVTIPGLILISPVLLGMALAVKLSSPGPVLYRRRVVGRGGREFDALKFRTMYVDGDAILDAHPELQAELAWEGKLKDDPRITPLGAVLRRFSLDELPQLWNVLRRQMSLVGPRMIVPAELEQYGKWDMNLLTVWPGITGLWQTSGRSDVGYEERVQMDMHYIRNYSIWLDLQILFRTVPAVLRGRGAY